MRAAAADSQKEFGDFQTPLDLAHRVVSLLRDSSLHFGTIVEPTCGVGAFLQASAYAWGDSATYWGFDINDQYVLRARAELSRHAPLNAHIENRDFYTINWEEFLAEQPEPILVVGNPPWVTNAGLGAIRGSNLPAKANHQGHVGLDAKTGKANFDISEWMLVRLLDALRDRQATIAVLCKTATARKVLRHAWSTGIGVSQSSIHPINATLEFGASVDACLLCMHVVKGGGDLSATTYADLSFSSPMKTFGLVAGELISDVKAYSLLRELDGEEHRKWRSGIKHDAASVMEFTASDFSLVNGLGEAVDLEDDYVFPLLKSSDLANSRLEPRRFVLVPQRRVGDSTDVIRLRAPKTWRYLLTHADKLDSRGSSIYKGRSRFSVFGVGDYSFSSAKVAISGLYKNIRFCALGDMHGKPIFLDDTCYFLPCTSRAEADFFADLLNSEIAQHFLSSLVFRDAKRPITADVLRRLDLVRLAAALGRTKAATDYLHPARTADKQGVLFA
jgi:hypothetical protein